MLVCPIAKSWTARVPPTLTSVEHPGTFLFHEVWESREHHTAHTRTPHFLRWNARKDALLASREAAFWQQLA